MSNKAVTLKVDDGIAVIEINNPPVNALSEEVTTGLAARFNEAKQRDDVKAVVLIGAGKTFIAGADIKLFGKIKDKQSAEKGSLEGLRWLRELEDFPVPIVAALHGNALGGGLEIAMACHYRICTPDARLGQPEVKLGIIPGMGGTQRLPRLVGVGQALQMITLGNSERAPKAKEMGLVDRITEGKDLLAEAIAYARELVEQGAPLRKTRDLTDKLGEKEQNEAILAYARGEAAKKAKGYLAPFKAIDAIEAGVVKSFDEGEKAEARAFGECVVSEQSRNLVHIFFATREAAKMPGVTDKGIKPAEIKKVGIIGAGTMGAGIAQVFSYADKQVVIKETSQELAEKGLDTIRGIYQRRVDRGRMTREQMDAKMKLLTTATSYDGFDDVDLVVEAVFEEMEVKKIVFEELDEVCPDRTILASNTSTLSIDEMAKVTNRPEKVIGLHYFSPAHVMPLLEVILGEKTDASTILTCLAAARQTRKTPVIVRNWPGFLVNWMLIPYGAEACFLLEEGATAKQIDDAAASFGMAMGPLTMSDMAGIDISYHAGLTVASALPERGKPSTVIHHLYERKRYGQKTGAGYYKYEKGKRDPIPDPELDEIVELARKDSGTKKRNDLTEEEIQQRLFFPMINQASVLLDKKIVLRPGDVDVAMVYGTGFPPFRGGPLKYADTVGVKTIHKKLREFEERFGPRFKSAPLLENMAQQNGSFYT